MTGWRFLCILLLVAMRGTVSVAIRHHSTHHTRVEREEGCPPCNVIFNKGKKTSSGENVIHDVRIRVRGEPKSGTTVILEWTSAALIHTCEYLNENFGENSCIVDIEMRSHKGVRFLHRCTILFEPKDDGRCACDNVDR